MNLNFLSGLLLLTAVFAIGVFVAKEMLGDGRSDERKSGRKFLRVPELGPRQKAAPVSNHLIGSTGKVISHSSNTARPMMVRIHPELWPARQKSAAGIPLPVGTAVKVAAVDGAVLVVEAADNLDASPDVG
jgi:hypothetical protein